VAELPQRRHLMPAVVVDTHTIVWYLSADHRLSANAAVALDSATAAGERIHVPSICLVELTYLVEKGRLPIEARDRLIQALDDPTAPCLLAPSTAWSPMPWSW
jgi:PIN domain nuclease of toxin-antitoxin system